MRSALFIFLILTYSQTAWAHSCIEIFKSQAVPQKIEAPNPLPPMTEQQVTHLIRKARALKKRLGPDVFSDQGAFSELDQWLIIAEGFKDQGRERNAVAGRKNHFLHKHPEELGLYLEIVNITIQELAALSEGTISRQERTGLLRDFQNHFFSLMWEATQNSREYLEKRTGLPLIIASILNRYPQIIREVDFGWVIDQSLQGKIHLSAFTRPGFFAHWCGPSPEGRANRAIFERKVTQTVSKAKDSSQLIQALKYFYTVQFTQEGSIDFLNALSKRPETIPFAEATPPHIEISDSLNYFIDRVTFNFLFPSGKSYSASQPQGTSLAQTYPASRCPMLKEALIRIIGATSVRIRSERDQSLETLTQILKTEEDYELRYQAVKTIDEHQLLRDKEDPTQALLDLIPLIDSREREILCYARVMKKLPHPEAPFLDRISRHETTQRGILAQQRIIIAFSSLNGPPENIKPNSAIANALLTLIAREGTHPITIDFAVDTLKHAGREIKAVSYLAKLKSVCVDARVSDSLISRAARAELLAHLGEIELRSKNPSAAPLFNFWLKELEHISIVIPPHRIENNTLLLTAVLDRILGVPLTDANREAIERKLEKVRLSGSERTGFYKKTLENLLKEGRTEAPL